MDFQFAIVMSLFCRGFAIKFLGLWTIRSSSRSVLRQDECWADRNYINWSNLTMPSELLIMILSRLFSPAAPRITPDEADGPGLEFDAAFRLL